MTQKDSILELHGRGLKNGEIANRLNINESYVRQIICGADVRRNKRPVQKSIVVKARRKIRIAGYLKSLGVEPTDEYITTVLGILEATGKRLPSGFTMEVCRKVVGK